MGIDLKLTVVRAYFDLNCNMQRGDFVQRIEIPNARCCGKFSVQLNGDEYAQFTESMIVLCRSSNGEWEHQCVVVVDSTMMTPEVHREFHKNGWRFESREYEEVLRVMLSGVSE